MAENRFSEIRERQTDSESSQRSAVLRLTEEALQLQRDTRPSIQSEAGKNLGNLTIVNDEPEAEARTTEVSDVSPVGVRGRARQPFAPPPSLGRPAGNPFENNLQQQVLPLDRLDALNPLEDFVKSGNRLGKDLPIKILPDGTKVPDRLSPSEQTIAMSELAEKLAEVNKTEGSLAAVVSIDVLNRQLEKQGSPYSLSYQGKVSGPIESLVLMDHNKPVMTINVPQRK